MFKGRRHHRNGDKNTHMVTNVRHCDVSCVCVCVKFCLPIPVLLASSVWQCASTVKALQVLVTSLMYFSQHIDA